MRGFKNQDSLFQNIKETRLSQRISGFFRRRATFHSNINQFHQVPLSFFGFFRLVGKFSAWKKSFARLKGRFMGYSVLCNLFGSMFLKKNFPNELSFSSPEKKSFFE